MACKASSALSEYRCNGRKVSIYSLEVWMFLPVEVSDLHEKPSVAAIETFFKLLVQGPGFRSIYQDGLNTCLEKPDFLMFRDA